MPAKRTNLAIILNTTWFRLGAELFDKNSNFVCNMHPHNYYLEILTETGLVGFIILVSAFLLILYSTFIKKYFSRSSKYYDNLIKTVSETSLINKFNLDLDSFFIKFENKYLNI